MFQDMRRFEARAFLCLVLFASVLFGWLLFPFFNVLLWAVVIAAVFSPVFRILRARWRLGPNPAALATVLVALFLIILPLAWLFYSGAREALGLYTQLSENPQLLHEIVEKLRASFPRAQELLANFGYDVSSLSSDLSSLALSAGSFLARYTVAFGGSAANFVANLAICLYVAFFFVRDGARLAAMLVRALPFGDHRERRLMSKFAGVMRATVKGSLLVAMAQGALGGLIFWILDIRAAILWGVAMAILSLIPVVGAAIVWLPTALYLLATGNYVDGVVLVVYGACVIGLADNVLRPILVGRDTKLPDYLVLLSTLGGFTMFGADGFVTGPLLAALFVTMWQIFTEETTGFSPDGLPLETVGEKIPEAHVSRLADRGDTPSEARLHAAGPHAPRVRKHPGVRFAVRPHRPRGSALQVADSARSTGRTAAPDTSPSAAAETAARSTFPSVDPAATVTNRPRLQRDAETRGSAPVPSGSGSPMSALRGWRSLFSRGSKKA